MINRKKFLNVKKFKQFFSCQQISNNSFSADYKKIQNLIKAVETDKNKWLLINEINNPKKTQPIITCLKTVFNNYVTDLKKNQSLEL